MSAGRILVIDDEPQICRIMRETLIAAGYEVDDARNGADGLDKVREFHPDLVLLDINMPEMSGVDFITKPFSTPELLAWMRAGLRRVPILSGSSAKLRIGELLIDF